MPFRLDRGIHTEIITRTELCNVLRALEPNDAADSFERGFLEALRRVGLAFAVLHESDAPTRLLDAMR